MPNIILGFPRGSEVESVTQQSSTAEWVESPPSVLDHLVSTAKMWWQHLTMRVTVPPHDVELLMKNCSLNEQQIARLYKQFRLLIGECDRDFLTVNDLEKHSSLLSSNPLKKYTYRMLFWDSDRLTFTEFVGNLSLTLSDSIGCPQLHLVKSINDMSFFNNVSSPKDVAQMQKLLALFSCVDVKETGNLDPHSLCPLLYDLLRCDSDASVSSLVPHSMLNRMVNTAIVCVHTRFPKVCAQICGANPMDPRFSVDSIFSGISASGGGGNTHQFEGHKMLLTKELFIRDQEDLHLDQLMAMRL